MALDTFNRAPAAQRAVATPSGDGRPTLFNGWRKGWQMLKDWQLECRIGAARNALNAAQDSHARRAAWERMAALIRQRSPQQVARMERKAGMT